MNTELNPEMREHLLDMLTKVAVMHHQILEIEDNLEMDCQDYSRILETGLKAHDLKVSLRGLLID